MGWQICDTQPTVIAREIDALTQPDPSRSSKAGYQGTLAKPYVGPPQVAVHPAPPNIQRPSSSAPAAQCVDALGEVRAAVNLHNHFLARKPIVRDTAQVQVHNHFHGIESTVRAALNVGLFQSTLIVGHQDMAVSDAQA